MRIRLVRFINSFDPTWMMCVGNQRYLVGVARFYVDDPHIALIDQRDLTGVRTPGDLVAKRRFYRLDAGLILAGEHDTGIAPVAVLHDQIVFASDPVQRLSPFPV